MTASKKSKTTSKKSKFLTSNWTTRLATATGALAAVALSPSEGKAAVIKVTGSPVTILWSAGVGATSNWDIDGDSVSEFRLVNSLPYYYNPNGVQINLESLASGVGLLAYVRPNYTFNTPLLGSYNNNVNAVAGIGPGNLSWMNNGWGAAPRDAILMLGQGYPMVSFVNPTGDDLNYLQYFGFRFKIAGQTHYGYAELEAVTPNEGNLGFPSFARRDCNINSPSPDCLLQQITISRWAFNSVPDQGLPLELFDESTAVPGPIGLAGLAAGAAWTRKLRRRIKAAA